MKYSLAKLRARFMSREITDRSTHTGEELVFCQDHNGEYVGWTTKERAEREGFTIERTTEDPAVLALLDLAEAARAYTQSREVGNPSAYERALRWLKLREMANKFEE